MVAELNTQAREATAQAKEADQKATEARLELEKFKAPRVLSAEQMDRAAERLKQFAGTQYDAAVNSNDPEFRQCLLFIDLTLKIAGWIALPWAAPIPVIHRIMGPTAGCGFAVSNVVIGMHFEHRTELMPAAQCIVEELKAAGIDAIASPLHPDPANSANKSAIHIMIGRKM